MLRISRRKEEGFHYLQEWFAESAAVEQGSEVSEGDGEGMGLPSQCCTDNALSPRVGSLRMRED